MPAVLAPRVIEAPIRALDPNELAALEDGGALVSL
jgi:hypothetical protein